MLDIENISEVIDNLVDKYAVKKVAVIGSYADGLATEDSDIDLLVEFRTANISLFKLYAMQEEISNRLNKKVDLIHAPVPEDALIEINKVVSIYEQ